MFPADVARCTKGHAQYVSIILHECMHLHIELQILNFNAMFSGEFQPF